MKYNFIKEINWLSEMAGLGELLYEINSLEEIENLHITSEPQKYSISIEELDARYADVLSYKKSCLKEAYNKFKDNSMIGALTTPYSGAFSNFTFLTSLSWVSDHMDAENISEEEILQYLMLALYSDAISDFLDEKSIPDEFPHLEEKRYNNSKWQKGNIQIDITDVISILQMTTYSEELKWVVLNLIASKKERNKLLENITILQNIIKKYFYLVEDRFENSIKNFEKEIDLNSINELFGGMIDSFENMNLEYQILRYNSASMKSLNLKGNSETIFIGIIIIELMEISGHFEMKDENVIEKCKALGDMTRFSIINLLAEKTMYVKELADALELSSATLSHHLGILMQNGFLELRVDDRRAYYSLKKESFEELGKYLQMKANTLR